jgi:cytoskeletal protein RodZ
MRPSRRDLIVLMLAVAAIVLAAAITWSTSQLVRQHIGLASEPLTAGQRLLAPAPRRRAGAASTSTATSTQPPSSPASTSRSTPAHATQPTQASENPQANTPFQPAGSEAKAPLAVDRGERSRRGDD